MIVLGSWAMPTPGAMAGNTGGLQMNSPSGKYDCEQDLLEVLFSWDSRVRMRNGHLADLASPARALEGVNDVLSVLAWHEWQRLTTLPEDVVDGWETTGESNTGNDLYNLNNIYRLRIPSGSDIWAIATMLEELPGVLRAMPVPKPVPAPLPPNYQGNQGYLNAATNNPSGVDATWAWTQAGGTGTGVTVCDVEYSWNYNHADITKAPGSQVNPNLITDPFNDNNHGTAVIGMLVADNNGWGTTGICYNAGLKTCGTYWNSTWNPGGALTYAINALTAGDVILIEQQAEYGTPGAGWYVPLEWYGSTSPNPQYYNSVYAAIVTAVANGIHVVEAGGNGNINTDNMTWYGNSGAIIVGAGGATSSNDRKRLSFSSYGTRFDLQGWGEACYTTGYGTLYNAMGVNYYYTATFNGTSSASPVVAGALACVEGYYYANISLTPPTPANMRTWLVNNGTPQVTPPTGNIGPRPNCKATIQNLPQLTHDFGDAPDQPYPTLLASNGARHFKTALKMGLLIDAEADGQPTVPADGDDLNPPTADDEDGVFFLGMLTPGSNCTVQVTVSGPGILNAWVDFNNMNAWGDPGEQVITNMALLAGTHNLNFMVPAGANPGYTYARFRFSTQGGLAYYGAASDGEVEDYRVFVEESMNDWGDAPDGPYPTLGVSNGARHAAIGPLLGALRDIEPDGQPNPTATGDDNNPLGLNDEDGVMFLTPLIAGGTATVQIIANGPGFLNAWIDYSRINAWMEPFEWVIQNVPLIAGANVLNIPVPAGIPVGPTFARFRFAQQPGLTYTGQAPDGEVEDYMLHVQEAEYDWGDAPDPMYPTFGINFGANHRLDGLTFLGFQVDSEPDGQPDPMCLGDDNDILYPPPNDDEDGVTFGYPWYSGQPANMAVLASVTGFLNVWIDFNQNGTWADPGEQVFIDFVLTPGINALSFPIPAGLPMGQYYSRFRFCTMQGLTFTGMAINGEVEDYLVQIDEVIDNLDWGDAPDPSYPTLNINNGASHFMDGVTFLGVLIDGEPDGQPDPAALGDDLDIFYPPPNDDEDGVMLLGPWVAGQMATVSVTASVTGYLNAWFDFNNNGTWIDPGEQVIIDNLIPGGVTAISFMVPPGTSGPVFSRFRFCNYPGLTFMGPAQNGEVEDYVVYVEEPPDQYDWGDAKDPLYPTLQINNGARHLIDNVTYLGMLIDAEFDGQPSLGAVDDDLNGIDDEDGVQFLWPVAKGNPCKLKVTASVNTALFNGWIDFNGDGDWADAGEHIFIDLNLVTGDNFLTFIVPRHVNQGNTYARFRFSHQPALSFDGPASDGEVEDYMIELTAYSDLKWAQPPDPLLPGIHATDMNVLADDWVCNGEVVTDLHWWGNYELNSQGQEKRGNGINHFILDIYSSYGCLPWQVLKTYIVPFAPGLETFTGMLNNEGSPIYKYNFLLPEPFIQVKDTTYWLSVRAISNDLSVPPSWRWQEANRWYYPILCGAAYINAAGYWQTIAWPSAVGTKYSDMAFEISSWVVDTLYLQNISVTSGQVLCYNATNVMIVAGGGTTFTVDSACSATMIAGLKIIYRPGTHAKNGSYMHGYITSPLGPFCPRKMVTAGNAEEVEQPVITLPVNLNLKAYPNPTTGNLIIVPPDDALNKAPTRVEVYGLMGQKVFEQQFDVQAPVGISLGLQPPGIYVLRVTRGGDNWTVKVIKQ